jgi:excisionase family DNA binding protein
VSKAFLAAEELADLLGVPVSTIRDWRYRGLGPTGLKLGRHVRYPIEEVERWLVAQRKRER